MRSHAANTAAVWGATRPATAAYIDSLIAGCIEMGIPVDPKRPTFPHEGAARAFAVTLETAQVRSAFVTAGYTPTN